MNVRTEEQMMNALVNYGAVAITVNAQQGFPTGPTAQVTTCAPISGPSDPNLDHEVVVVGWQPCQVREVYRYGGGEDWREAWKSGCLGEWG